MIHFNVPPFVGTEFKYMQEAVSNHKICGDGPFTKKCNEWLEKRFNAKKVMLTTSGSTALDMAALLCGIKPGDEVILPSFTFSSTANSFVLAGATLVFVDVRPDTMNIDETKIEAAITDKTKVIVPVHYAGVACEMDAIMEIARKHKLLVVEDSAQGVMGTYKGRALGTIGDMGCYSFHETKNYSMGEGGALMINDPKYNERAEIIREKGTNRARFFRGQVDKYTWVDYGSSYLPSDMNAAYLWGELEVAAKINNNRLSTWTAYYDAFSGLASDGLIDLPTIPDACKHNAHMFYVKLKDLNQRTDFISFLRSKGVQASFHYVPLHSSPAGERFGRFSGIDEFTTRESDRLVRLPMYYSMDKEDRERVIGAVLDYFSR